MSAYIFILLLLIGGKRLPKNGLHGEWYKKVNQIGEECRKGGDVVKGGEWKTFEREYYQNWKNITLFFETMDYFICFPHVSYIEREREECKEWHIFEKEGLEKRGGSFNKV